VFKQVVKYTELGSKILKEGYFEKARLDERKKSVDGAEIC
jgi:hypothetical protein